VIDMAKQVRVPKCPGGKIRSYGRGRGLGTGKKRGPIGVPKRRR